VYSAAMSIEGAYSPKCHWTSTDLQGIVKTSKATVYKLNRWIEFLFLPKYLVGRWRRHGSLWQMKFTENEIIHV
jgi:hypothetical protein